MMSFLNRGPNCGSEKGQNAGDFGTPIAMVGDFPLTSQSIEMQVSNQRDQQFQQTGGFDVMQEANAYAGALKSSLHNAYIMSLAKQQGVAVDDKNADQALPSLISQQIAAAKEQMTAQGKIKPNATEQEFVNEFKKEAGQTPDEFREAFSKQFHEALQDPARRESMLAELSRQNLLEKYGASVSVTDQELMRAYSTLTFKRILLGGKHGAEGETAANGVLDKIKGGMSFEEAITQFSTEKGTKGKPASEATMDFPAQMLSFLPAYQPLNALKIGEVSKPLDMPEGVTIYKLVKETPQLPKDFAQNKEKYRTSQRDQVATAKLAQEAQALEAKIPPQWKSPGYEAIYEFDKVSTDTAMTAAERAAKLKDVETKAAAALTGDTANTRVAALAQFAANSAIYSQASPEEKKKLAPSRISAIENVLVGSESPRLRIELADLYLESGRTKEAVGQLKNAAQSNNSMDVAGQSIYSTIQSKLEGLKAAKKIDEADAKDIETELNRWRQVKLDQQKMEAESKAREAQLQKDAEAASKRAAEEAKKAPTAPKPGK